MLNRVIPQIIRTVFLRFGRNLGPLFGLAVIGLCMWGATPFFLTFDNLRNVILQSSINTILALGLTFVIITAGIDLSVGSILALAGIVLGMAIKAGLPVIVSLGLGIAAGALFGLLNGALIAWGRLQPFIVTLGMMSVARGLALVLSEGRPISGFGADFRWLATGTFWNIPIPIWSMALLVVVCHLLLRWTAFGRRAIAIGGNEEAAILSGVNVKFLKLVIYGLSGLFSALAAVVLTARLNSASPTAGMSYELDAIAAAVIGGTSLTGGTGSIPGTLIGALIISVLRNGLNLLNVSSYLQSIIIGSVIVVAALLDRYLKANQSRL